MVHSLETDEPVVRLTTTDTEHLVPALLRMGVWVRVSTREVEIRGLSESQAARVAASQLAAVTDLTTVSP